MADSMCGPSNALQNFQKHSTIDRTLQQDRLVSRQSPAQGFRSNVGPNAGFLDPEFEAFQAGQLPLDPTFQQQPFSHAGPSQLPTQAGSVNWASDFQRMNISSPVGQLSNHSLGPQIQQRHDVGGWHQEFVRQQSPALVQNTSQSPYQRYTPITGMMGAQFGGGFVGQPLEASMVQQKQPEEAFDEEAFARAFEAAARTEIEEGQELTAETLQEPAQGIELGQDIMIEESAEQLMASDTLLDQQRIGADAIYDPMSEEFGRDQDDPNALAKTAGHLLESIRYEQSSKFQNSQFLELMRQFRDGQATVEGDKVIGLANETIGGVGSGNEAEVSKTQSSRRELAYLTQTLKKLILDRDRPFERTPENVRGLLHLLLQMERVASKVDKEILEKTRVQRMLSAVILNPALKTMPSIAQLAKHVLDFNILPPTTQIDESRPLTEANSHIEYLTQEPKNDIAHRYIAAQISSNKRLIAQSTSQVLGYAIPSLMPAASHHIHEQRVQDILGTAITHVLKICQNRGMACPELGTRVFFDLVGDWERFELSQRRVDYDAFVLAVVSAERDVEDRLIGFLGSVGGQEREFGVGVEVLKERMEVERRLKDMRTARAENPFPGEERWDMSRSKEAQEGSWGERAQEMRDRAEEAVGRLKTGRGD